MRPGLIQLQKINGHNAMEYFKEQPKFEIKSVVEQKPFENKAVDLFFAEWCRANDSIEPLLISRSNWEQLSVEEILTENPDGRRILYLPRDLQLWEMVGVMEAINRSTFVDKPERQSEAKERIIELGKTFQNAGIYIIQRLNSIKEGQEIAKALAEDFYDYGHSLTSGKKPCKPENPDEIYVKTLSELEIEQVDRFLAGENLYQSRQARAEKLTKTNPSARNKFYEAERQKTLAQFFRVSAKSFETKKQGAFLAKISKAMLQKIEEPKTELMSSIFRRGMELLQKNMPFDKLPGSVVQEYLYWENSEKTLRQALQIDRLKAELEDVRKSGDMAETSTKERKITDEIQGAVSNFTYELEAGEEPATIAATQRLNCVGASILGGALMKEAGLNYLVGDVPEHSILFLVTSDGNIEWRDMLHPDLNEDLTNEMIDSRKKDGSLITVADIVAFSKKPLKEGLMLDIKDAGYREKVRWAKGWQRQYVALFGPEYGQQLQVLNNIGVALDKIGYEEEAAEAFRQAIELNPKLHYPYQGLGGVLLDIAGREKDQNKKRGQLEQAADAFRQAIAINPSKCVYSYLGLGDAARSLGRHKEAVSAYQKFIKLADKDKGEYYNNEIRQAEKRIAELERG